LYTCDGHVGDVEELGPLIESVGVLATGNADQAGQVCNGGHRRPVLKETSVPELAKPDLGQLSCARRKEKFQYISE
jgi:hypothetical protein